MPDDLAVRSWVEAGEHDRAATSIVETYGAELFGFLVHTLGNEADAGEVFSQVAEDLWKGLPAFGFRCSVRTWVYVLGRHAIARYKRSPWQRRASESKVQSAVDVARSRTQPWLRTEVKDKFAALREGLGEEDRTLLVLRVDRDLAWNEIACVMLGVDEPDPAALGRETDRLRKRFQLLKGELRRRAEAAGLLDEPR